MRSKRFFIILNEASEFTDSAKGYFDKLTQTITNKQERIKKIKEEIAKRQESDDQLEKQTKESQGYNSEQIKQKKAGLTVTKDPAEQRRIRLELVRLDTESKRISNTLKNLQIEKQEFIKNKNDELKEILESISDDQEMQKELQQTLKDAETTRREMTAKRPAPQAQITAENIKEDDIDKYGFIIKRRFARMEEQTENMPTKKTLIVNFDKSTKTPFQVKFTERGFLIGDTRLSFEFLEAALSKDVNIVLENGTGLVLDSVRMEKILKYKDRV